MTILAYNETGFNIGEVERKREKGAKGFRDRGEIKESLFAQALWPLLRSPG
jgi:hypothetical protein